MQDFFGLHWAQVFRVFFCEIFPFFTQVAAGGKAVALATQCLTDTFSVTNSGGYGPSSICGTNTGEHSKCTCG